MITSMLEGKPSRKILRLTLPMVLSMLFQQMYNLTDSIIVGNVEGANALTAVGESYLVTMIFMGVATGASIGITVVVSRLYGASEYSQVKTAIYTSLITMTALAAVLSVLGAVFSKNIIDLIGATEGFKKQATDYLSIYFYGLIFVYAYNCINGILNALGDSVSVLLFLIFSSILNVGLDIWFVAGLRWGVAGAAWATLISQAAAAILAVIVLLVKIRKIKCEEKPKVFSLAVLKKIGNIALPSILQHTFVSVGNLFVISRVNNMFSDEIIAGINAALKINTVAVSCLVTVSNASSSFTAQNLGGGNIERVKKGAYAAVVIGCAVAAVFFIPFMFFGKTMVNLFIMGVEAGGGAELNNAAIIECGAMFLRYITPIYFLLCLKIVADGVNRGAELMPAFLISTFSDLFIRVVLTYVLTIPSLGLSEKGVFWAWSIGWLVSIGISLAFYFSGRWKKSVNKDKIQKDIQYAG